MPSVQFEIYPAVSGANVLSDVGISSNQPADNNFIPVTSFNNFGDRLIFFYTQENRLTVKDLTKSTSDSCVGFLFLSATESATDANRENSVAYRVNKFEINKNGTQYAFFLDVTKFTFYNTA